MSNYFSDLFGLGNSSSSSNNDPFGINLADYASIKNGSYRKLLAANYAKTQEEEGTSSSSSSTVKDSKQTLTSISDAASDLQKSISTVSSLFKTEKDENGRSVVNYDEDKMYKALKDFVNNYNSLLDEAGNAESTSLLRTATSLVSFTKANEKALESVGISVGSDNKLSIDEDKFKEASKSSVQSLFQSTGGYAYQVDAKASSLKITADELAKKVPRSSTGSSKSSGLSSLSTSKDSTKTLANIQEAAEKASKSLAVLLESGYKSKFKTETKKDENGKSYTDYDRDGIYSAVKDFIKDYNSLLDKTEDSTTSSIAQARKALINYAKANESALKEIGITIDSDDNLVIDKDKFMNADMAKVKALFQNSGSFGKQVEAQYTKIEIYAENEASKSNTYNNSGSYSYNYNSGDWFNSGL